MNLEQNQELQKAKAEYEAIVSKIVGYKVESSYKVLLEPSEVITMPEIVEAVASAFEITAEKLKSRNRKKPIPDAKALVSYIAYSHLYQQGFTLRQIANGVGLKDHGSIINARDRAYNRIQNEDYMQRVFNAATERLSKRELIN